ncbi:acylglycerol kinase, mitochondrial-like [Argonauta hians]
MSKVINKVVSGVKTVRTHWKKSILICGVASYGVRYANSLYRDEQTRRAYCAEAIKYGTANIQLHQRPRIVTVFLNPAVSRGKGVKLFEKNAAPLLHLAGIIVNVVKTEYEGQVKQLLTVLEKEHTDAIVVAGGDGTLLETVTGVMRKSDNQKFCQAVPVGVIPLGQRNRFATWFFGEDPNQVKFIMDAAMAVIKSVVKPVDVLEIKTEDGRNTYAMSGLQLGVYNDAEERKSKYWYFGPLKSYWTYLRTAMKKWPPAVSLSVEYVPSTADLTVKKVATNTDDKQTKKFSLFNFLYKTKVPDLSYMEEYEVEDKDWVQEEMSTVELTVTHTTSQAGDTNPSLLDIGVGPASPQKTSVIQEGWSRANNKCLKFGCKDNDHLEAHRLKLSPNTEEGEELWYNVDGEAFEARPVEIGILRKRLRMFYHPPELVASCV